MLFMMLFGIRYFARLIDVPKTYLVPILLLICVVGTYAIHHSLFDVWVMLAFGIIALGFRAFGIPLAPFVIGLVLAPIAEESFRHAVIGAQGDYSTFLERPISAAFLALALLVGLSPLLRALWKWRSLP
jgi:putative tricarboxylic transport membrane protein